MADVNNTENIAVEDVKNEVEASVENSNIDHDKKDDRLGDKDDAAAVNGSIEDLTDDNTEANDDTVVDDAEIKRDDNSVIHIKDIEDEWTKREKVLLEKITMLEKMQNEKSSEGLHLQLQVKCEENDILKTKIKSLEMELSAVLNKPNAKNKDIVKKIKKQHEELLTKAKGMIFDKIKMIKNQELQIEALTTQVSSLKEVVRITKDLLGIRNLEVTHLQEKLEVMDMKIQAEKERQVLMIKKIESGTRLNEELRREYHTQLAIFKELKVKYEEKIKASEASSSSND